MAKQIGQKRVQNIDAKFMSIQSLIAEKISTQMKKLGLTNFQLSELLDVSPTYAAKVLKESDFSIKQLLLLSEKLDFSITLTMDKKSCSVKLK